MLHLLSVVDGNFGNVLPTFSVLCILKTRMVRFYICERQQDEGNEPGNHKTLSLKCKYIFINRRTNIPRSPPASRMRVAN